MIEWALFSENIWPIWTQALLECSLFSRNSQSWASFRQTYAEQYIWQSVQSYNSLRLQWKCWGLGALVWPLAIVIFASQRTLTEDKHQFVHLVQLVLIWPLVSDSCKNYNVSQVSWNTHEKNPSGQDYTAQIVYGPYKLDEDNKQNGKFTIGREKQENAWLSLSENF